MFRKCLGFLESKGISVRRTPFQASPPIDVLALLIEREAQLHGPVTVVQVGANDGQTGDPVSEIIRNTAARAILIEPLGAPFAKLSSLHRSNENVTCLNVAVGPVDGTVTMWGIETARPCPDASQVTSFQRGHVVKHLKFFKDASPKIVQREVVSMSPRKIATEHQMQNPTLLQIDAEGYDAEVIRLFLDAGVRPAIINFESLHLPIGVKEACHRRLEAAGYRFLNLNFDTIAYRRNGANV